MVSFKRKLLFIFLLFLLIILFKSNNVFATFDFTYNNVNYSLPDIPTNHLTYMTVMIFPNANTPYIACYYTSVKPFIFKANSTYYRVGISKASLNGGSFQQTTYQIRYQQANPSWTVAVPESTISDTLTMRSFKSNS